MIIKKTFIENSYEEARKKIEKEMGKNALIVSENEIKNRGIFGKFKKKKVEVIAVIEEKKEEKKEEKNVFFEKLNEIYRNKPFEEEMALSQETSEEINEKSDKAEPVIENENDDEKSEIKNKDFEGVIKDLTEEIKSIKESIISQKDLNKEAKEKEDSSLEEALDKLGIPRDYYKCFKDRYEDNPNIIECIKEEIDYSLEIDSSVPKGKVAIVGSTGCGKTTTVAKLASYFNLIEKRKVALVTMDIYRIGAADQLESYAEIMKNVPFRVATSSKNLEEIVKELEEQNYDLILIDTIGRSSKNLMQISELRSYLSRVKPNTTFLAISSTTKDKDIQNTVKAYKELNFDRVIVTKLDETISYGSIYTIAKSTSKPITYVTNGQYVPQDISLADKDELSNLICGGGKL